MSKELVYRGKCDICMDESIFEIDSPEDSKLNVDVPVTVGDKTVLLDLCDSDLAELRDRFEDYLSAGREPATEKKPKRKSPTPRAAAPAAPVGSYACTEPGCGQSFQKPQGLGRHRSSMHGLKGRTKK